MSFFDSAPKILVTCELEDSWVSLCYPYAAVRVFGENDDEEEERSLVYFVFARHCPVPIQPPNGFYTMHIRMYLL